MKSIGRKVCAISVLLLWLWIFETNCDSIDGTGDILPSDRILSRKRRYLIFPKGSSIQLVYDSVITIPDYTIYVVTGVTCALAWGLPDQPIYPEDDLMHRYEQGDLPGLQYRNDVNVTEDVPAAKPSSTTQKPPSRKITKIDNRTLMKLIRTFYTNARRTVVPAVSAASDNFANEFNRNYYWNSSHLNKANSRVTFSSASNKKNFYYTHPPVIYSQTHPVTGYLDRNANTAFKKYMADTYFKPWISAAWSMQTTKKPTMRPSTELPPFKPKINKLHTIYPAMGKRSIPSDSRTWREKFYLDHHRSTRHELYAIIEKYLFAKGFNGTACVLKTLCEVGKKRSDSEPGSFLAELVRTIFSLPEPQKKHVQDMRLVSYDEAHRDSDDCMRKFANCPSSIWSAGLKLIEPK